MSNLKPTSYRLLLVMTMCWPAVSMAASAAEFAAEVKKNLHLAVPCSCAQQDKTDLESRIKQVEAAIKEYDALIKEWETKERGSKESLFLTRENRGSVQGSVGFRMSGVRMSNARSFGAETDAACATTIDPEATPCLRGALQDHESVHKKACDENKSMNPFVDWRDKQRVVDYMKEEQAGYQKELARLKSELDKMKPFCSLDPSVQAALKNIASEKERQGEAYPRVKSVADVKK
ncbi:MAG TPA: hypothetical protein VFM24_02425 [Nitrospira sp.]|nr:hypothetical protein [Nitrospira sp.]